MTERINCHIVKNYWSNSLRQNILKTESTHPTLEVHEDEILTEIFIKNVRTYICAHGKCKLHYNRSHRRISTYNWNKMQKNTKVNMYTIISIAEQIINNCKSKHLRINKITKEKCELCHYPKIDRIKHIHFIKGTTKLDEIKKDNYKPIETVFNKIDDMAGNNNIKVKMQKAADPPGQPIVKNNKIRMTYGDINYLGSNKAILYFNRGIRGIQEFTNSMYPLQRQPKHKDLIVLDDIVFTSSCKCDSIKQHDRIFPHYRVTCAIGLTCPARLNKTERIIYARNKNATTEMFTSARSMLVRY